MTRKGPPAKLSPLELSGKSASARAIDAAVAALNLLVGNHGSGRILTTNRHFEFGEFEEIVLTMSPRNTAQSTSMRFVLSVTRSKPKDPALRRRARMLEKLRKNVAVRGSVQASKSRSANGAAGPSQKGNRSRRKAPDQ